jgi:pteridine reductase
MTGHWAGKTVLVTGAARRVGRAIALAFADAGADVAVHHRASRADAEAVVAAIGSRGRRARAFAAELTDPRQAAALVADVVAELGGLDALVNSAASFVRAPFVGGADAEWERAWRVSVDTNLVAPARLARLAAPGLAARQGVIVNLLDIAAMTAWPAYAHHGAAKAGLEHLTRALAIALAPDVRVVGVSPGIAEFPHDMPEPERRRLIEKTALRRPGRPEDVAEAVLFLAGQRYTTGVVLPVDGGWSIRR